MEMQIKMMKYHYTPTSIAKFEKKERKKLVTQLKGDLNKSISIKAVKNSIKKLLKYVMGKLLDTSQEEISSMLFSVSLVA